MMSPAHHPEFFDINSDRALFRSLKRTAQELRSQRIKETERVLYLLMGLNNLREWIAPGFKPGSQQPTTEEERYFVRIWALPEFRIVNNLSNHSKHQGEAPYHLETQYGASVDEYPDVDAVHDFDLGPPLGYHVDGRDLLDIIDVVIQFYESEWYGSEGI